jgi:hypothetical protein
MKPDLSVLNEKMIARLQKWSATIGPRPAGGAGEIRLQQQISSDLRELGFSVEEIPFRFAPEPVYLPYYSIAALFLIVLPWFLMQIPWAVVILPFIPSALPAVSMALIQKLPRNAKAVNLLALPPGVDLAQVELILCAHTDTARAVPAGSDSWFRFRLQSEGLARRIGWILLFMVLIHLLLLPLSGMVFYAGATFSTLIGILLIVQDLWEQLGSRNTFAPGMNDDASGVAVLLSLAEYLQKHNSTSKVGFLFTSAEECGLFGAQAFAGELKRRGASPRILGVDMVGAGDHLRIIHEAGELFTVRSDREMIVELDQALPEAVHKRLKARTGDFAAFIRGGFQSCGVESSGTRRSWRAYHTLNDDMGVIDPTMLELTLEGLIRWVEPAEPSAEMEGGE